MCPCAFTISDVKIYTYITKQRNQDANSEFESWHGFMHHPSYGDDDMYFMLFLKFEHRILVSFRLDLEIDTLKAIYRIKCNVGNKTQSLIKCVLMAELEEPEMESLMK